MLVRVDATKAIALMEESIGWTQGFAEGMQAAGPIIARKLGEMAKVLVTKYIDSQHSGGNLHHVYEWGGGGRLFHMRLTMSGSTANIAAVFQQSKSISSTSDTPFYRKAWIMEEGTALHIEANPLLHMLGIGEWAWTGNDVVIPQPGGPVAGTFKKTFYEFFNSYFSTAFLEAIGFASHFAGGAAFASFPHGGYAGGKAAAMSWINSMPGVGNIV